MAGCMTPKRSSKRSWRYQVSDDEPDESGMSEEQLAAKDARLEAKRLTREEKKRQQARRGDESAGGGGGWWGGVGGGWWGGGGAGGAGSG